MTKLVLYRLKTDNSIIHFHEYTEKYTEEALKVFNEDEKYDRIAEVVELDELAEYFYTVKMRSLKDYLDDLIDLRERLDDIAYDIGTRADDLETLVKKVTITD